MNKFLTLLIEIIFWLATVLSPTLLFFIIGIILYIYIPIPFELFITIVCVGLIIGVFIAEKIRTKYGCSNYWGRILSTEDIRPNSTDNNSDVAGK